MTFRDKFRYGAHQVPGPSSSAVGVSGSPGLPFAATDLVKALAGSRVNGNTPKSFCWGVSNMIQPRQSGFFANAKLLSTTA